MIEHDQLRAGLLVWWERKDHQGQVFDGYPGVITAVDREKGTYRIRTFDDLGETDDLNIVHTVPEGNGSDSLKDESRLKEMRPCDGREIRRYVEDRTRRFEEEVIRAKRCLEDAEQALDGYRRETKALFDEHGII